MVYCTQPPNPLEMKKYRALSKEEEGSNILSKSLVLYFENCALRLSKLLSKKKHKTHSLYLVA